MDQKGSAATEFREFARTLPSTSAQWDPFSAYLVEHTPLYARAAFRDYALGVYMSGRHFIRRVIGGDVINTDRSAGDRTWHLAAIDLSGGAHGV